jgi:hypothetical protein
LDDDVSIGEGDGDGTAAAGLITTSNGDGEGAGLDMVLSPGVLGSWLLSAPDTLPKIKIKVLDK